MHLTRVIAVVAQGRAGASATRAAETAVPPAADAFRGSRRRAMKSVAGVSTPHPQAPVAGPAAAVAPREHALHAGRVHVYSGEGKGKTTAAMGLALRALGHDKHVFIGQFVKTGASGEVKALSSFANVVVEQYGDGSRLRPGRAAQGHIDMARHGLARAREVLQSGDYDLVILDEIDIAISCGLLTTRDCLALLDLRPDNVEVVLTGRWAPRAVVERADLVTEMREVKHYYRQGVEARAGIEY